MPSIIHKIGQTKKHQQKGIFSRYFELLLRNALFNIVASIEDSVDVNMKSFWRFINGRKGHVSTPNIMTYGDRISHNDHHVCQLFSDNFGSVYDKNTVDRLDNYLDSNTISGDALANIVVPRDEVLKTIKQLDNNKGPGPDGVPAFFVQRCAEV
ncbi:hypothetical protein EVAR_54689_1 [Eumeta japonica]|uniref:RNA-directed DNA polymerase from transposon BS n=1 Tax=Eumeta variegata TaxID=151549 RepID=A0A4C1X974_EUMVA|nr:hypothetical protein EVAR_54689_1 [Eumeta japonica]